MCHVITEGKLPLWLLGTNEVRAKHCLCLLYCLKHDMVKWKNTNKCIQRGEQVPFRSERTSNTTLNTDEQKSGFIFLKLTEMQMFVFSNNKGIDTIVNSFLCVRVLYWSIFNECVLMKSVFLATSSTHWLNCTSFQSKLKRIVLACKTSPDSPTEEKTKCDEASRETLKSAIRTTQLFENRQQITGKSPPLYRKCTTCLHLAITGQTNATPSR